MKNVPDGDAALYIDGEKVGNPSVDIFSLESTIPLMQSKDYKDRFVAEWAQTKIRLSKLNRMLQRYYDGTLDFTPTCPVQFLEKQTFAMERYVKVLEMRALVEKIKLPTEKLMEGET